MGVFKCEMCEKSFSQSGHLKRHVEAVHKKLKPFQCGECDRAFYTKRNLQLHVDVIHRSFVPIVIGRRRLNQSLDLTEYDWSDKGPINEWRLTSLCCDLSRRDVAMTCNCTFGARQITLSPSYQVANKKLGANSASLSSVRFVTDPSLDKTGSNFTSNMYMKYRCYIAMQLPRHKLGDVRRYSSIVPLSD
ncbi:hypothetical protein ACTXT7_013991 [Hymenolepis weldensis]